MTWQNPEELLAVTKPDRGRPNCSRPDSQKASRQNELSQTGPVKESENKRRSEAGE
jgi:hypothetical protein